jgi:uncharacterized protein (TIGR03435 family)
MRLTLVSALAAGCTIATIALPAPMQAQTQPPTTMPAFEVASVKASINGMNGVRGGCHGIDSQYSPSEAASAPPLGRCVISDGRLSHIIGIAFEISSMDTIHGGPDWLMMGSDRFNIEAKAENPATATRTQLLQMLQALLAERFQLKFHRESVDRPGFALLVAKGGPKLVESKAEETATSFGAGVLKPMPGQPIALTARKYSMAGLARLLSLLGPGPVVDKTGLDGVYDFKLSWDEGAGPSLSTAIREQLGLRFESQKVPVSLFIVDSAQKPGGN